MDTSRHLKAVPSATDSGPFGPPSGLWRNVALASVVLAIVLIAFAGGVFSPQLGAELQTREAQPSQASTPEAPQKEFVYFPSQHMNQGTEGQDVPTF